MVNIKKIFIISFISLAFLVTGCSSKEIKSAQVIEDEATYQKTMTKVQNNVNEIIGKDHKYVLENMGCPYCTTYYIDIEKERYISSIEDLNNIENIRLIYPKESIKENLNVSSLYIQINHNIVKDVQTYELLSNNEKENITSNIDIVIDKYYENISLSLQEIESLELNKYIEKNLELFLKEIEYITPNFDIYDNKREKNIKVYILNEENSSDNKIMLVYNQSDKIKDIKIMQINDALNLLNNYSSFE